MIKISQKKKKEIDLNLNNMLLFGYRLVVIESVEYEEIKAKLWGKPQLYVKNIEIIFYDSSLGCSYTASENFAAEILNNFTDLFQMRKNWINVRDSLEGLGFTVTKKKTLKKNTIDKNE